MLGAVDEARVQAGEAHAAWPESFDELFARVAGRFGNAAVRGRGRAYLVGLLSQTGRENGWTLAEFAGDARAPRHWLRLRFAADRLSAL